MLRNLHSRRRSRYGTHVCAIIAALLLLTSVSLLHSRLGSDNNRPQLRSPSDVLADAGLQLDDADPDDRSGNGSDDRIDELDVVQDESDHSRLSDEEESLRGVEFDEEENDDQSRDSSFYFDHVAGVIRRAFDKRSIDLWEDYVSFDANLGLDDRSKVAFGSDDVHMDEKVRRKLSEVKGIEDALLLKIGTRVSPLREGWGVWFDSKSDFLRKEKMFRPTLEILDPLHNPLLQDPDGIGVTVLTKGDKLFQQGLLQEFESTPFLTKEPGKFKSKPKSKHLKEVLDDLCKMDKSSVGVQAKETERIQEQRSERKRTERRTIASIGAFSKRTADVDEALIKTTVSNSSLNNNGSEGTQQQNTKIVGEVVDSSIGDSGQHGGIKNPKDSGARMKSEFSGQIFANGKRWGYFPGLHPRLSFSNFMDSFFKKGKCQMRVFMVWNSPPWMFSIRHQRGLESLLFHHRDACVVVFSETIELNFFRSFLKDGFKVAVVMPNLDELLKDTPTHIFASVWFEWKKTDFYNTHYSELVRLAALYKYGGIYLDSDIIVLKTLSSLKNTVGLEDQHAESSLNGAVMSFRKHSPFIKECLTEFYSTYDDTRLRWNGADLLTRVARNFLRKDNTSEELTLQPSFIFFPINRNNITRFFSAPSTDDEIAQQQNLLAKILKESITFHFWNSLTSALIPEPGSLVARLIDNTCIRCSDVL